LVLDFKVLDFGLSERQVTRYCILQLEHRRRQNGRIGQGFIQAHFGGNFPQTSEILPPISEVRFYDGLLTSDSCIFHNTSEEIQKLATYSAKRFQLLGPSPPNFLIGGSASGPRHSPPQTPAYFPNACYVCMHVEVFMFAQQLTA